MYVVNSYTDGYLIINTGNFISYAASASVCSIRKYNAKVLVVIRKK